MVNSVVATTHNTRKSTNKASVVGERFYTPEEVAKILGVSVVTVNRWIRTGFVKAVKVSKRVCRVPESEVERVKSECEQYLKLRASRDWVPITVVARKIAIDTPTLKRFMSEQGMSMVHFKGMVYKRTLVNKKEILEWLSTALGRRFKDIPEMVAVRFGKSRRGVLDPIVVKAVEDGKIPYVEIFDKIRILKSDVESLLKDNHQKAMDVKPEDLISLIEVAMHMKVGVSTVKRLFEEKGVQIYMHNGLSHVRKQDYERLMHELITKRKGKTR